MEGQIQAIMMKRSLRLNQDEEANLSRQLKQAEAIKSIEKRNNHVNHVSLDATRQSQIVKDMLKKKKLDQSGVIRIKRQGNEEYARKPTKSSLKTFSENSPITKTDVKKQRVFSSVDYL